MPKELQKAATEDYLLCPACSEEASKEVFVHKSHIRTEGGFLSAARQVCPKGHPIPEAGA